MNGKYFLTMLIVAGLSVVTALAQAKPITRDEVNKAQQKWCDTLVEISQLHAKGKDYKSFTEKALSDIYYYDFGKILFKPTLAHGKQTFRTDKEGTLAYFIGGNKKYPGDSGFALKNWKKVTYDNSGGIVIDEDIAMTMGNVFLTDGKGNKVMVDKTFVFKRAPDGKLRIVLHKSALPFSPGK
ncbi:hypothetical protein QPK87_15035 [Kamptonema cortianum]|nr:hypothetical protein [Oscillatoria laete-virens]MDK3157878.1 hypothetical protein [Kamptonema cortianum]MDL5046008.1 hypothetical protein [Oscillatoria amoena NRMC-F 0135]MDL5052715.1 hypothetical protein [Oscillatoria laete-virens NRMC-F 0139]